MARSSEYLTGTTLTNGPFRFLTQELPRGSTNADLASIPNGEAHLGVELTIGNRTYYTGVTFFETKIGNYSTTM